MKNNSGSVVAALGVLVFGWWYYERSRGLSITGQPINPMLAPATLAAGQRGVQGSISAVNPGSTPQTNLFSIIGQATSFLTNVITKGAGNTPAPGSQPTPPRTQNATTVPAAVSTSAPWVPTIGDPNLANNPAPYLAYSDPTSRIYWPPLAVQPDYIAPNTGVPLLGWTLPAGFDDIPPPPGS